MGSDEPSFVTVHVTGFKKFEGVAENPTEAIVGCLKEYMENRGMPKGLILGSFTALETSGQGARETLTELFESALESRKNRSSHPGPVIWLHLGVNGGNTQFALERQAFNEATFPCPDERGWAPTEVRIINSDGDITNIRKSSLPVTNIVKTLKNMGYKVTPSDDAGRFVCNYVYYLSLWLSENNDGMKSLFVHTPLFETIDQKAQMEFVASLLEVLASLK